MAQHDFVISNDTGKAVRLDIQEAFQALAGQNYGLLEPTTTYPFQVWADNSTDTLKVRNAADDGWISVYTLSTGIPVENGTALAVTYAQSGSLAAFDTWMADPGSTRALPASPVQDDEVMVKDYTGGAAANNITIGNAGNDIQGVTDNLVLNVNFASAWLKYDSTQGWRLIN